MTSKRRDARERLALGAVRATGQLSRALSLGSGSTIGGSVGLAIDPGLVASLTDERRVALVSGTNGKTTTTRFLADALAAGLGAPGARPHVAWSQSGANMPPGIVSALADANGASVAVLEVDEAYLARVVDATRPEVVVLLNLSRDQLDRVSEVRMLAARWAAGLEGFAGTVVANADDPLVVFATRGLKRVRYVAAGGRWHADAYHCPVCDESIRFIDEAPGRVGGNAGWRCGTCDFARPRPDAVLDERGLRSDGAGPVAFDLEVPGRFNRANAALAAVAAEVMGVALADALRAIAAVAEVAGRFSLVHVGGVHARLLLAKNPAGWSELLELVAERPGPLVVAINARVADGRDPSWLFDVDFETLAGREVVATGERRLDLAVRLLHAGVAHLDVDGPARALRVAAALRRDRDVPRRPVDVIGNYTAFQELRRLGAASSSPPEVRASQRPLGRRAVEARTAPAEETPHRTRRITLGESALRVVVVHPDLLGTYGDGGNARVLANRALWRDYDVELVLAPSDRPLPRSGDLYCLGGGEDGPQLRAAELLRDGALAGALTRGAVLLAVCAGFQVIGETFAGPDGSEHAGVGLLPVRTVRGTGRRAVGEVVAEPTGDLGGTRIATLSGFENHAGHTVLGEGLAPLAHVLVGVGNDRGGTEGALAGRVVGTYLHGPVLARNPDLADALLSLAVGGALAPLDDRLELALRATRITAALRPPGATRRSSLFARRFIARVASRPSSA